VQHLVSCYSPVAAVAAEWVSPITVCPTNSYSPGMLALLCPLLTQPACLRSDCSWCRNLVSCKRQEDHCQQLLQAHFTPVLTFTTGILCICRACSQPAVGFETAVTLGVAEELFVTTGEQTLPFFAACGPAQQHQSPHVYITTRARSICCLQLQA
jgi:hypothetical protein